MAKTKMVVRVPMDDCKARSKALKICVSFDGVESACLKGETVEVVGVGVDPVKLTRKLRKCMPCTDLLSLGEVKEEKPVKEEKEKPVKEEALPVINWVPYDRCPPYYYSYSYPAVCCDPPVVCAIL